MTEEAAGFVHATALVLGERGVLIEGAAGSGKSTLAAALLRDAVALGRFARLVGDDRVSLQNAGGRLIARPHPAIEGLLEQRGVGLLRVAFEPACVLHLVVRLLPAEQLPARLPEAPAAWSHDGIPLPLLIVSTREGARDQAGRVADALARPSEPACLETVQSSC